MFGKVLDQTKPAASQSVKIGKWWVVLMVCGALFLFVTQALTPSQQGQTATQSDAAPEAETSDEEGEFLLPEYEETTPLLQEQPADTRPFWLVVTDLSIKLALVIGLIYAALAGLRWLQRGSRPAVGRSTATIQVLETTGLSTGSALHLVMVGEKTLLLGATAQQISLLAELETPTAMAAKPEQAMTPFDAALTEAETKETPELEWQVTMDSLRQGIQKMRASIGE